MSDFNCIVVLGTTASGKTRLACNLAYHLNGEIISADSRQVYKQLTIGSGKDLEEYVIKGQKIEYHLIDVIEPQEQFYLHQFIAELKKSFEKISSKNKLPIICGGTGLYLDTLRKDFSYTLIKENDTLRNELKQYSKEELILCLKKYPDEQIKHVDLNSMKRLIRGIEVAEYLQVNRISPVAYKSPYKPFYIGINVDTEERKKLIANRLLHRINNGLIEEVNKLLESDVTHQRLQLFGLEYKFVSDFLQNKISKEELIAQLQTAIFQFAKRQMTWFRKMEKEGVQINWIEKNYPLEKLIDTCKQL